MEENAHVDHRRNGWMPYVVEVGCVVNGLSGEHIFTKPLNVLYSPEKGVMRYLYQSAHGQHTEANGTDPEKAAEYLRRELVYELEWLNGWGQRPKLKGHKLLMRKELSDFIQPANSVVAENLTSEK